jgi:signal transduction histidine kinase
MPRMPPQRRHSILVVDDEPDVVQSVKDLLRLDYKVYGATRAADAMRILEEQPIDVVMTDQRMPEMTGVEFLQHVKDPHPDATRLLFTGYADIGAVIEAINQGNVYRYIAKPWDPDELQTIIREACERHDLIVHRKQLMAELEQKNAELQFANEELRRASELKSAFIQVASHELRTPLAIAQGFSELASKSAEVRAPLKDWLDRTQKALKRLGYLVNQIITMLEAGQFDQRLNRRDVNLGDIVHQAVDDVRPFLDLRKQKLVEQLPSCDCRMSLDADKIRDAVNHLLLNAIKFTPDEGTISVALEERPDEVVVRVADTGCGIAADHLPRIGEAFFTGFDVSKHSSGTHEHGRQGVGLGLSVVKAFIELHGGKLDVQSEVGCGSTFAITLPKKPAAADAATSAAPAATAAATS